MDILRTDTKNNFLSNIAFVFQDFSLSCRNDNLMLTTDCSNYIAAFLGDNSIKEVSSAEIP